MTDFDKFQDEIIKECLERSRGGISLTMGSGKTYIALKLAREQLKEGEKCLIIVAKTLIESWKTEINKFFKDSLNYIIYHKEYIKNFNEYVPPDDCQFVITNPETISSCYKEFQIENDFIWYDIKPHPSIPNLTMRIKSYSYPKKPYIPPGCLNGRFIYATKWGCLFVDEVQNHCNITSSKCLAISSLCARHKWGLSGSMLTEPDITKLLGYHFIIGDKRVPRNLPDATAYFKTSYPGINNTMVIRKTNVAYDPPNVIEKIITHELSDVEAKIYLSFKSVISEINKQLKIYKDTRNTFMVRKFSSYLLAMITYLRQILVCPLVPYANFILDITDLSCKSEMLGIVKNTLDKLDINDYLNDENSLLSSRIIEILQVANHHINEKIIVFTCFRTNLKIIKEFIKLNRQVFTIESSLSSIGRLKILKEFESSTNGVMLLTYEIGAEGLNLQFCHTILLSDFWWNDAKTTQAIARILRYGQRSNVVNVYFFTSGTGIENAILKKHKSKIIALDEIEIGPLKTAIKSMKTEDIIKFINTDDNVELLHNMKIK
jgi:SNF2 family DNA or RNA helicase